MCVCVCVCVCEREREREREIVRESVCMSMRVIIRVMLMMLTESPVFFRLGSCSVR